MATTVGYDTALKFVDTVWDLVFELGAIEFKRSGDKSPKMYKIARVLLLLCECSMLLEDCEDKEDGE